MATKQEDAANKKAEEEENEEKIIEHNPRWKGYTLIMILSLFNFINSLAVPPERIQSERNRNVTTIFGIVTFIISFLILAQDRSQKLFIQSFHYSKVKDGYFEGGVLLFMVIWWIVGVAIITTPGGIAYLSSNIYYSSWLALFACAHTLNLWSGNKSPDGKDILSVKEIVGVSKTLKSWWVLFLGSCIVFSVSITLHKHAQKYNDAKQDTPFAIVLGFVSTVLSGFHILVHYNFFTNNGTPSNSSSNGAAAAAVSSGATATAITAGGGVAADRRRFGKYSDLPIRMNIQEGGYMELFSSIFLILIWCIGVALLTEDDSVAATMDGKECKNDFHVDTSQGPLSNCHIIVYYVDSAMNGTHSYSIPCMDLPRDTPGSNLYYAVWICFLSSLNIALNWKRAQALQLASQAQEQQQQQQQQYQQQQEEEHQLKQLEEQE